jgi:hypothetical protein
VTRWTVTVHARGYEPPARYDCGTWLEVHALRWWWRRKQRRYVTVARTEPSRLGAWWARVGQDKTGMWRP